MLILIYIDNIVVSSLGDYWILSFKIALDKDIEIIDLSKLQFMLGNLVTYNHARYLIYLNQIYLSNSCTFWHIGYISSFDSTYSQP